MPKLKAYELQDHGLDTVEANVELGFAADCREYELPARVLNLLGIKSVRLMTNNPEKVSAIESAGITVAERVSAEVVPQESFAGYLKTKHEKMGHILETVVAEDQSE
jgi:GTP cyclohydrolase II